MRAWAVALLSIALSAGSLGPAIAGGTFEDAIKVYNSGDEVTARQLLTPLAEAGDTRAEDKLQHIYYWGEGIPGDNVEAHKWAERSAEQGDAEGEEDLGADYALGIGVPVDFAKALVWYTKAADQGDAAAQAGLAWLYQSGLGVPKNQALALQYLRKSATQGDENSQAVLGAVTFFGVQGAKQDFTEGVRLLKLAADQRNVGAQLMLGSFYFEGLGLVRDPIESAKWLSLAATGGCQKAIRLSPGVSLTLTPNDKEKVADLVAAWTNTHPKPDPHDHRDHKLGPTCNVGPVAQTF